MPAFMLNGLPAKAPCESGIGVFPVFRLLLFRYPHSAPSGLFCQRTGHLPGASWGHCIWVTVPLWVMGRSSSRWGLMWLLPVVLRSSRAGARVFKCWQLRRKIWKAKKKWGVGGKKRKGGEREITEESAWIEKREMHQRSPNHVRWWLPCQVLNRHYICFWRSNVFWCCGFLPHKSMPVKRVIVYGASAG